jgi:hypothetical protein
MQAQKTRKAVLNPSTAFRIKPLSIAQAAVCSDQSPMRMNSFTFRRS